MLCAASAGPSVRIDASGAPQRVSVLGLDPGLLAWLRESGAPAWPAALRVYTGTAPGPQQPPVAGAHALDALGLHFTPRFAFVPGLVYVARFAAGGVSLEQRFEVQAGAAREAPRVLAVYPSGGTLPANTLRLYVQFSAPMLPRGVHRHVRLFDVLEGEEPMPFVELEQGLWDPGQTRLTLVFHPGRVKRGVAPGERLGPPLRAGHEYRLELDAALQDLAGVPLGRTHEHRFRAGAADRVSPSAAAMQIRPPRSPLGLLRVELPEPLDQALLQRFLWIEDAQGETLDGAVEVSEQEAAWIFRPARPWRPGRYALRVHPALEDRAGNRFDRPFDRDGSEDGPPTAPPALDPLRLTFDVPDPAS